MSDKLLRQDLHGRYHGQIDFLDLFVQDVAERLKSQLFFIDEIEPDGPIFLGTIGQAVAESLSRGNCSPP